MVVILCIGLVGCKDNKEKAKWADKIDDRYARYMDGSAKTPYTYADLLEKINEEFGESNYGTVTSTDIQAATGILLNMPANLENSAVATGLEKVSFHSNPKERQCQRMLKLLHNCTHLTR